MGQHRESPSSDAGLTERANSISLTEPSVPAAVMGPAVLSKAAGGVGADALVPCIAARGQTHQKRKCQAYKICKVSFSHYKLSFLWLDPWLEPARIG